MNLKTSAMIAACMLGLTTLPACNADEAAKNKEAAAKPEAGNVLATVNGTPIPQSRADLLIKKRIEQGQADTPQLKASVRESLIHRELIIQEALKKGLDKNPDVATQIDMAKQDVLVNAFVQDYLKNTPVNDDALKAEYEKIKTQMGDKEYKARHILVDDETEAKAIIAQIKKGAKFEKLAEKSKDPSKSSGGDLGWSPANAYVKPFADAMTALCWGTTNTQAFRASGNSTGASAICGVFVSVATSAMASAVGTADEPKMMSALFSVTNLRAFLLASVGLVASSRTM